MGRYLVVQMDNGEDAPLHLKEVSALGFEGEFFASVEDIFLVCQKNVFNDNSVPDQHVLEEDCNATCREENCAQSGTTAG